MQLKLNQLKEILAEISDINHAANLLGWDMQVNMPPGAAQSHGDQLATLSRLAHNRFTSSQVRDLLEALIPFAGSLDPNSDDACLIRVIGRRYEKQSKVSSSWVAEFARVTSLAQTVWTEARVENNFRKFQPHLEKIIELVRQYADFFAPYEHVYDPLLDGFEPNLKTKDVQSIFSALLPQHVELVQSLSQRPQVDNHFLFQEYDEEQQWNFAVLVLKQLGYNWTEGRMDRSAHPFTTALGHGDVRITTRLDAHSFSPAFFAAVHEGGHALYDQGIPKSLYQTMLDEGASMAIHESQSRLWENFVGRSLPFWEYYYPKLRQAFPGALSNIDLETFYKGINRVQPSLIRVEADEATYNLHIVLRLELEIALVEGSLKVKDLPQAWNESIRNYLGITPSNDSEGVLQDIHWSNGLFGYFPTYALGNIIAAQLWEKVHQDIPDLSDQMANGEFSGLLRWLRTNIHRHGAKYEPQELLMQVVGHKIDPQPYVRYLSQKFSHIYGL